MIDKVILRAYNLFEFYDKRRFCRKQGGVLGVFHGAKRFLHKVKHFRRSL